MRRRAAASFGIDFFMKKIIEVWIEIDAIVIDVGPEIDARGFEMGAGIQLWEPRGMAREKADFRGAAHNSAF